MWCPCHKELCGVACAEAELDVGFSRFLVEAAGRLGLEVIDRCNLTVLLEPGQEDLVDFLAEHKVFYLLKIY